MKKNKYKIIIVGAGPAGLTAAWEAEKFGYKTLILESTSQVGGISRTVERDGWRFDIGGHRFFTKVDLVNKIWDEILDRDDFLLRPRMSRIYYKKKFFDYPLKPLNALSNLGLFESIACVMSYIYVRIFPPKDQNNFENWVAARFGWRLYNIFFKTYTEKVWGIEANKIGSDWASQRIKNLSLSKAILNAFFKDKSGEVITTLIDEFKYPKFGPGMMWETAYTKLTNKGHKIVLNSKVKKIEKYETNSYKVILESGEVFEAEHVITSMPLASLPSTIYPNENKETKLSGESLKFRDFLSVALVLDVEDAFPDNWIYIHEPGVKVGRIQNYGSWSPYLIKEGMTCLGLEYFVNENDNMWNSSDDDLIELAKRELEYLKIIDTGKIKNGYVVRMPKAYPVYDLEYQQNITVIRRWLENNHANIHPIGRNGMHRYNNQDHSMVAGVLTVRNILNKETNNIWEINVEDEYHEEKILDRSVPKIIED
jgi:protoporphyrinogen oxidase